MLKNIINSKYAKVIFILLFIIISFVFISHGDQFYDFRDIYYSTVNKWIRSGFKLPTEVFYTLQHGISYSLPWNSPPFFAMLFIPFAIIPYKLSISIFLLLNLFLLC